MCMFRPMRRFRQQLSDERCTEILQTEKRGVLAVNGDDGYPYTVPMNFVFDAGKVYFHCAVEGHKLDAVKADAKASFCVLHECGLSDDGWSYYVDSVVVFGSVAVVEEEAVRNDKLRKLGLKYFPTAAMVEHDLAKNAPRAVVLELTPLHITGKHVHES